MELELWTFIEFYNYSWITLSMSRLDLLLGAVGKKKGGEYRFDNAPEKYRRKR